MKINKDLFIPKFRGSASFERVHPISRPYRSTFELHPSVDDVPRPILPLTLRSDFYNRHLDDYIPPEIM